MANPLGTEAWPRLEFNYMAGCAKHRQPEVRGPESEVELDRNRDLLVLGRRWLCPVRLSRPYGDVLAGHWTHPSGANDDPHVDRRPSARRPWRAALAALK